MYYGLKKWLRDDLPQEQKPSEEVKQDVVKQEVVKQEVVKQEVESIDPQINVHSISQTVIKTIQEVNPSELPTSDKIQLAKVQLKVIEIYHEESSRKEKEKAKAIEAEKQRKLEEEKMKRELFMTEIRYWKNMIWSVTLVAFITWILAIQYLWQDLIPQVLDWWREAFYLLVGSLLSYQSSSDGLLNPMQVVNNVLTSFAAILIGILLLYLLVKEPRLGSLCLMFTAFHLFWHSLLRLLVFCFPIYILGTLCFMIIATSSFKLTMSRLSGYLVMWLICVSVAVFVGLVAVRGDPLNPNRTTFWVEKWIEESLRNYVRNSLSINGT